MFHVGQKVVCIDPTWGTSGFLQRTNCPNLPTLNEVYTVRDIICHNENVFVRLVGILNPPVRCHSGITEAVFEAHKYRPVVERKTDVGMAILKKLLAPNQLEKV